MIAIVYHEHLLGCGRHGKATRDWANAFTKEHDVLGKAVGKAVKQNIFLE